MFYDIMQINNDIQNQNIHFAGLTRTLSRNYFATLPEIQDVFTKHQKADNIAGSLPYSWIKSIQHNPKPERDEAIKSVYSAMRRIFGKYITEKPTKNELKDYSKILTHTLRKAGIIPDGNIVIINKRKVSGSTVSGIYTIHEKGKNPTLEKVLIKKYREGISKRRLNTEGAAAETALGLHLNKRICDRHILKFLWGDINAGYTASHYEVSPQNVKIPKKLSLFAEQEDKEKFFKKLMKLTNDFTDIRKILAKYGFKHYDFHDENILITRDKKGNLITKLIDIGRIDKAPQNLLDQEKFITYNYATKSFE